MRYGGPDARKASTQNEENEGNTMTKSELIEQIAATQTQLSAKDIELAVKAIISYMADVLSQGGRIEIRGFGSFSLHYRAPRTGRNPKTGEPVVLSGKYVPHFKPGKELRDRVNNSIRNNGNNADTTSTVTNSVSSADA